MAIAYVFIVTLSVIELMLLTTVWADRRIYDGQEAKSTEFPSLVFLYHKSSLCTGCIIHEKWVLAAAHCIHEASAPNDLTLIAGCADYVNSNVDPNAQTRHGKTLIVYPSFVTKEQVGGHDVGLIEVDNPFKFTDYVSKLELSKDEWPKDNNGIREKCIASGWGLTNSNKQTSKLMYLHTVSKHGQDHCPCITDIEVLKRIICLPALKDEGICSGDSGGPLICDNTIVGVAQGGMDRRSCDEKAIWDHKVDCGNENSYGIYMYAHYYADWIHDTISSSSIDVGSTSLNFKITIVLLIIYNFYL